MQLSFSKYQGTGNDFILINNREGKISLSKTQIAQLCHRRFGIGADGLMLLETAPGADFRMVYFNADGAESTMCGNGGRCITAFARSLGLIGDATRFLAIDGLHEARIDDEGEVRLQMIDVPEIRHGQGFSLLDTGSPHYVTAVQQLDAVDVYQQGKAIRHRAEFAPGGLNVNFVERKDEELRVRTFERGVEDETLSCGTGVVASALAFSEGKTGSFLTKIVTPGGRLEVSFEKDSAGSARNIWLKGPAVKVFEGKTNIEEQAVRSK